MWGSGAQGDGACRMMRSEGGSPAVPPEWDPEGWQTYWRQLGARGERACSRFGARCELCSERRCLRCEPGHVLDRTEEGTEFCAPCWQYSAAVQRGIAGVQCRRQ